MWIGIWLLLSTMSGFKRDNFWSLKEITLEEGAPYCFHHWMSGRRFKQILAHLRYNDGPPPQYKDRFWEVRGMVEMWNKHMADIYEPGWVSCLDESISIWTNRWTCPGWTFIPRKPHPIGNEYHTICCGTTGILYQMEMVEGKDMPKEVKMARNVKRGEETIGLLLRLTRSLYSTGKVVILDSGFCVLRGLIELRKVGVFASALIKKRRYWPRYVPGDAINEKMKDKKVGECDSLNGVLNGQNYDIFCLKEPDYVMKVMSTYGGLVVKSGQEDSRRTWMEGDEEKLLVSNTWSLLPTILTTDI